MAKLPEHLNTFHGLIRWLAEEYHRGAFYPMAKRVDVSASTILQWRDGIIKKPTLPNILQICGAYGLEVAAVIRLAYPDVAGLIAPLATKGAGGAAGRGSSATAGVAPAPVSRRQRVPGRRRRIMLSSGLSLLRGVLGGSRGRLVPA